MLQIHVKGREFYDERTNTFVSIKPTTLRLEHSLISVSKWESKWHKPFLGLEEFEEQLQFKDAGKGFEKLSRAVASFTVDPLLDELDSIGHKFSVLETVVETFVRRASSDLYGWAKGFAKSLSVDQITSGFSKYETNVRSVNTIATATGKSVEEVNGSLQRLLWYTGPKVRVLFSFVIRSNLFRLVQLPTLLISLLAMLSSVLMRYEVSLRKFPGGHI